MPFLPVLLLLTCTGDYPRGELLAEPATLAKAEAIADVIPLDVRSEEAYAEGHIPGARRVDPDAWKAAFGDGEDAAGWSERIGGLGIAPQSRVVVYSDKLPSAARVWWILRYWGVDKVQLLDGGWSAWQAAEGPTSTDVPTVESVRFTAVARPERLATKDYILGKLEEGGMQVVDSRTSDEHCGIDLNGNLRGGAIPGAKHLDWTELVDPDTGRFLPADALRAKFADAGIALDRPSVAHCQSGGRSSVMTFAMELLGADRVRNYYRSWAEWGNAEDTPIETPEK